MPFDLVTLEHHPDHAVLTHACETVTFPLSADDQQLIQTLEKQDATGRATYRTFIHEEIEQNAEGNQDRVAYLKQALKQLEKIDQDSLNKVDQQSLNNIELLPPKGTDRHGR